MRAKGPGGDWAGSSAGSATERTTAPATSSQPPLMTGDYERPTVALRHRCGGIRHRARFPCESPGTAREWGAMPPHFRKACSRRPSQGRRILVVAVPPVDELDLVGPLQVFNSVNRLAGRNLY